MIHREIERYEICIQKILLNVYWIYWMLWPWGINPSNISNFRLSVQIVRSTAMKPPMASVVLWCFVLFLSANRLSDGSMVTSIEKIRDLAEGRIEGLGSVIEKAIQVELEKVQQLTKLLVESTQPASAPAGGGVAKNREELNHPNDIYLLIKRHVTSTEVLGDAVKNTNVPIPTADDLSGARLALLRLQKIYKLDVTDMAKGNYSGYLGSPLEADDAYVIGRDAFQNGYPAEAIDWLKLAANMWTRNTSTPASPTDPVETNRVKALALLGRAYFYSNKTALAYHVYAKIKNTKVNVGDMGTLQRDLQSQNHAQLISKYRITHKDTDFNTSVLCSRHKEQRVEEIRPYHVCRYKCDVYVPYVCFKEEILNLDPYVSVIYQMLYDHEVEHFKKSVRNKLIRGRVIVSAQKFSESKDRTGELSWIGEHDPVVAHVSKRVQSITRLDTTDTRTATRPRSAEEFQVVNYGLGGHYDVHLDSMVDNQVQPDMKLSGNRLATFLLYLSDVELGGSTIFPRAGISVSPIKGMGLLWFNFKPNLMERDQMTHHAGCPVLIGNKWIANKWIWLYGNTFRRPCGLEVDTQQLTVEDNVSKQYSDPRVLEL